MMLPRRERIATAIHVWFISVGLLGAGGMAVALTRQSVWAYLPAALGILCGAVGVVCGWRILRGQM